MVGQLRVPHVHAITCSRHLSRFQLVAGAVVSRVSSIRGTGSPGTYVVVPHRGRSSPRYAILHIVAITSTQHILLVHALVLRVCGWLHIHCAATSRTYMCTRVTQVTCSPGKHTRGPFLLIDLTSSFLRVPLSHRRHAFRQEAQQQEAEGQQKGQP